MNEQELRTQLLEAGANKEDLNKIDFAKIQTISEKATDVESLCKAFKENYPNFKEEEFKKAVQQMSKDCEESEELSDEQLADVAGGSAGSWFKKNKNSLIALGAVVGVIGLTALGTGLYSKYKAKQALKEQAYNNINRRPIDIPEEKLDAD